MFKDDSGYGSNCLYMTIQKLFEARNLVSGLAVVTLAVTAAPLKGQQCAGTNPPCVLTAGYAGPLTDANFNSRQGINPYEKHFSPGVLPGSSTAAMFLPVDIDDLPFGAVSNPIMAQPLYVTNMTIANPQQGTCSPCNVVIAVTLNGTVFAWNADGPGAGNLLWSRHGVAGLNQFGGNSLWYDDCGAGSQPAPAYGTFQFTGVLSTPTIDATGTPPVMFLTSECNTSAHKDKWILHMINLLNGADINTADITNDVHSVPNCTTCQSFTSGWQFQRPAVIEVKNSGNATTPVLIYLLFGTSGAESAFSQPYSGWVVAYTAAAGKLSLAFAYSDEPSSCGAGGGYQSHGGLNGQCNINPNAGSPPCDCYAGNTSTAPNWGGHGGGCWMSGNGPAATAVGAITDGSGKSDNAIHVFFGCGNGGYQSSGLGGANLDNFGQTVMDFRLSQTGYDSAATGPFQTFTPNSPAAGLAPPLRNLCGCTGSGMDGCGPCHLTVQNQNGYDYDMAISGVTLFKDLAGNQRLVTVDKAGYGYLLSPGNLCGSGNPDTPCIGFAPGDPGSWTFGATRGLCQGAPNGCDRVTSLAVFDNQATGPSRAVYLAYWPYKERLTSLKLSDNVTPQTGKGLLKPEPSVSPSTMTLSATCTIDQNCLTEQLVAGDALTLNGCSCQAGANCPPVVTAVSTPSATDSRLTLNMPVATAFGSSCAYPQNFQYTGYFVTPAHNSTPLQGQVGYPGGAVMVTANCAASGCTQGLVWAILPDATSQPDTTQRGLGTLFAYVAVPNAMDILHLSWFSTDTWCASAFVRPMIVNGNAFVPTYAVSNGTFPTIDGSPYCPVSAQDSGEPYPSGLLVYN